MAALHVELQVLLAGPSIHRTSIAEEAIKIERMQRSVQQSTEDVVTSATIPLTERAWTEKPVPRCRSIAHRACCGGEVAV